MVDASNNGVDFRSDFRFVMVAMARIIDAVNEKPAPIVFFFNFCFVFFVSSFCRALHVNCRLQLSTEFHFRSTITTPTVFIIVIFVIITIFISLASLSVFRITSKSVYLHPHKSAQYVEILGQGCKQTSIIPGVTS